MQVTKKSALIFCDIQILYEKNKEIAVIYKACLQQIAPTFIIIYWLDFAIVNAKDSKMSNSLVLGMWSLKSQNSFSSQFK